MPRRQRPAGSETWICVASRCCCRAAYLCSPASSLYAARNTWKVRNVRTLCLITIHSCSHFTRAQKTRRISRGSREREGMRAETRAPGKRVSHRVFSYSREPHRHSRSSSCIFYRCERFAASASPYRDILPRRELASSGVFLARGHFTVKWKYLWRSYFEI